MDWGGQLLDLSNAGASIRLHPAAIAAPDEACTLMLQTIDGPETQHRWAEICQTR